MIKGKEAFYAEVTAVQDFLVEVGASLLEVVQRIGHLGPPGQSPLCDRSGVGEQLAGLGAGGFVVGPDQLAVDEDFFNAGGEFVRLREGGVVDNGVGVEEDEVGV